MAALDEHTPENPPERDGDGPQVTRREAVAGAALAAAVVATSPGHAGAEQPTVPSAAPAAYIPLRTMINGQSRQIDIDPRTSLLDLLRERLALTGAKKGCDHGQCGACTVHVDGRRVVSCLTLAAKVEGRKVLTIEGLSPEGRLHPMQQAFIDHDALQCGYCTPGQIMSAVACIAEGNASSRERIREYMSGNICRCGAYVGIVSAIEDVGAKKGRG